MKNTVFNGKLPSAGEALQRERADYLALIADVSSDVAKFGNIIRGSGSPSGVVSAAPGVLYVDSASTLGVSVWRKFEGVGNSGWVILSASTGRRNVASLLDSAWAGSATIVRTNNTIRLTANITRVSAGASYGNNHTLFTALPNSFWVADSTFSTIGFATADTKLILGSVTPNDGSGIGIRFYGSSVLYAANDRVIIYASYETNSPWPATLPGVAL